MSERSIKQKVLLALFGFSFLTSFTPGAPCFADVIREDRAVLSSEIKEPVYTWSNPDIKPKAVAIAVHGLTMHGAIYDTLARHLTDYGFIVLAPDLHGYGRWLKVKSDDRKCSECGSPLCYMKSRRDLIKLIKTTKETYPDLPLYLIGESLGADMALYAASERPHLINGLVLSAPAIKRKLNLVPRVARDTMLLMQNPFRDVDLVPYMKKFASEDPNVISETVHDPLVRKRLSLWELFKTINTIRPSLGYADKVPESMPVLIMQGDKDRMLKTNAVVQLMRRLNSTDQTVRWFSGRGHLLLETNHMHEDTLTTVTSWLREHVEGDNVAQLSVDAELKRKYWREASSDAHYTRSN